MTAPRWTALLITPLLLTPLLHGQTYPVGGTVINALTNSPLSRVTLSLTSTQDRSTTLYATQSDGEGKFLIPAVPGGKYSLNAHRNGYPAQTLDQHGTLSTAVIVGPNADASQILFRMMPPTGLTVLVLDEENQPIRQARVELFCRRVRNGEFSIDFDSGASTIDTGRATFRSLAPGTCYAVVLAQPWYAGRSQYVQYKQPGVVEELPRTPLEVAYPATWYGGASDLANATPIVIERGAQPQVTVNLQPVPAVRVKIPIGQAPQGQFVQIHLDQPGAMATSVNFNQIQMEDTIFIFGLAPGHYIFEIRRRTNDKSDLHQMLMKVDVAGDMTLSPAAASPVNITGRITTDLALPTRGSSLQLHADAVGGDQANFTFPLDDHLSFKGSELILPGRYYVATSLPMTEVTSVAVNGQPAKPGSLITLPAGDVSLTATVGLRRIAEVVGLVTDEDKPRAGVAIYLLPASGKNLPLDSFQDQSDSDGTFSMEVKAGKYIAIAIENGWGLEYAKPEVMAPYLARGTPVEAQAGTRVQVKLEVQPRQ